MLRFQHPLYLYTVVLSLVFTVTFILLLVWRKRKLSRIGNTGLIKSQLTGEIAGRSTLKFLVGVIAFILIAIGCANLQKGGKPSPVERKGIDVMIALDVSKSMLAQDVTPNRLVRAQQLIERLMDKLPNDRIGLIVFAGRPYLQVPLTGDHGAVQMALQSIRPETIPSQGTVIGEAIEMATQSFSKKERKYKSLILISDGEDHDERAISAADAAAEDGVAIHTVGIGSAHGIVLDEPGTDIAKLDETGKPIITKLNEKELQDIAKKTHGSYTLLANADVTAGTLAGMLSDVEQKTYGSVSFADYSSYFQAFLLAALLLLIIEVLLPGARKLSLKGNGMKKAVIIAGFVCISSAIQAQERKLVLEGNALYDQQRFKEATEAYQKALQKNPSSVPASFNLSDALVQQKQYEQARNVMMTAAKTARDKSTQGNAHYNIGNTYMEEKKWDEAVKAYKQSLRTNPADADAKYNLSYALSKLKQEQQEKQKDQQDDKQKKNEKDKQPKNEQPKDKKPEQQQSKLTKQQADNLLNALAEEEKKLRDRQQKENGIPARQTKDW